MILKFNDNHLIQGLCKIMSVGLDSIYRTLVTITGPTIAYTSITIFDVKATKSNVKLLFSTSNISKQTQLYILRTRIAQLEEELKKK